MAKPFDELRERLLREGVAPRHVRRYINELTDHLSDLRTEEERSGRTRADSESAALARLGEIDELAKAMICKRQLQSWSARAPWAAFGLMPLLLLAAAWFVSLFLLWAGWNVFLPGSDTPFGAHQQTWFANLYFQIDRAIFFGAPILLGWGIMLLAARQRMKAIWPMASLVIIATISGTTAVSASRTVPYGMGHIRLNFTLGSNDPLLPFALLHGLVVLTLTILPALIWRWRKAVLPIAGLCLLLSRSTFGQAPVNPEFEVADIRRNVSTDTQTQGGILPGGQFSVRNATLKSLLGFAFDPAHQRFLDSVIAGAPSWVDTDRFDISAKAPPGTPARQCFFSNFCLPEKAQALMLRALLEKRFKLVTHVEQRPMDAYALVTGKGPLKIRKPATPGERNCHRIAGGSDDPLAKGLADDQAGFVCTNMTMANLADLLPDMAGAYIRNIVVDLTGLQGSYDFKLVWVARANIDQGGITIFDALNNAGLKLEQRKLPVPVVVIDHIEKLSEEN